MRQIPGMLAAAALLLTPIAAGAAPIAPWKVEPFPSSYRPGPRVDTLFVNATILDGAGKRIDNGELLIRDGRIVAIGRSLDRAGAQVIDAGGRWITPGIIDVHSHNGTYVVPLTDIDNEASDVSELASPNSADTWIETAMNAQDVAFSRALASGVTMQQILPGSVPIFGGRSVVVRPIRATTVGAMKVPGAPYGFKMACGENPKSYFNDKEGGPTSRQGVVTYMRRTFMDAQAYARDWARYAAGQIATPPARDMKREAIAGILSGDIRLNFHCYRAGDMDIMLAVAKEFGFRIAAFHHAAEAYKIPARLRETGTCSAVWGDWWGFKLEALDGVRANAALLERAGACVTMHSDSPAYGQRLTLETAKVIGAAKRIGITVPPETAIKWTTSNAARVLGLESRVGTLAPGYGADVVLWSTSPFSVYARADLVLIDGSVAYDRSAPPETPSDFELGRIAEVVR